MPSGDDNAVIELELVSEVKQNETPAKSKSASKGDCRRILRGADPEFNRQFKYSDNRIKTSKYNAFTFLPLNLFEQFHRFANIYFLVLIFLQAIPLISSVGPIVTLLPLLLVLGITAVKDLVDDISRHRSDRKINNRTAFLLPPSGANEEVKVPWQQLQVGEVVLVKNDQPVPADMLLLSTSDDNGLCFVETVELDGETNLKVRQALSDTQRMFDKDEELSKFDGKIECESPNNNLNRFEGRLEWNGVTYSLNNDNLLLRGCTIRNTSWAHGIVIFAGKETKLMKNSGKSKMKRTRIDEMANKLILAIFGFLILLLVIAAINCFFFESQVGRYFKQYSFWYPAYRNKPVIIAVLNMFSFLILIQTVIPISLYVSIELIRVVLSRHFINSDLEMYYEPLDTPAVARTTTLNEELGQIEYIFSDKTGTLTQNIMTFNRCSIGGDLYGDPKARRGTGNALTVMPSSSAVERVDFSKISADYYEPSFRFYDWSLIEKLEKHSSEAVEFFTLLALCHTVIADTDADGRLVYKAQSPDEAALVSAARNFGFVYKSRTPNSVTINALGEDVTYKLLCVLDFDNVRKRMSVVVEKDGRRQLLCKGADTLVLELLDAASTDLAARTKTHLSVFAGSGLRTLCCAAKDIGDAAWADWSASYHAASTSLEYREDMLSRCYEDIERDMRLVGATAVEDKLQDGVPETIFNLAKAGIKIWVLTGDKQETAINIGYSCNMLDDTMEQFVVEADSAEAVEQELRRIASEQQRLIAEEDGGQAPFNFGFVITGPSLMHALVPSMQQRFLEVACLCKTVICCRVTPLQKAQVVSLVKDSKQTVTLAIGDGANDVNMIKTAHIGVGISGQEGMQAVLSSDFSFAQFRYLQKLLLVHGRWAYLRIAIFLRYFFYKNFAFTICHYWFGIYSGWSANTVYDSWLIMCYNLVYTLSPIICYGWFEQDVNAYYSQAYPQLYQPGLRNALFNLPLFLIACFEGILSSVIVFFTLRYGFGDFTMPDGNSITTSKAAFGVAVGTINVIVVTVRCVLEMSYITTASLISIFIISLLAVFLLQIAFAETLAAVGYQFEYYGIGYAVWASPNFWLCGTVAAVACCLPLFVVRLYRQVMLVTLTDRVRMKQRVEGKQPDDYSQVKLKSKTTQLRRSRKGSGFAFAQQPNTFGSLIQRGVLHESHRKSKPSHNK